MAFIGNTNTTQAFTPAIDYFSGNGSTTAFTLSRPVASVAQVQVTIDNVAQNPSSAYTVSANTITFTSAPLSGTNNIYVYYTSPITQVIAPGQGTVTATSMASSTGTGAGVFQTSPTITTPTIDTITSAASTALTLKSAGTTAITVDASQNVGIGTASPTNRLDIQAAKAKVFATSTTGTNDCYFAANNTGGAFQIGLDNSAGTEFGTAYAGVLYRSGAYPIVFYTNAAERMRIDSSGNLLVGCTALPSASVTGWAFDKGGGYPRSAVGTTANSYQYLFYNPNGQVGAINTSGSATAYNTSSDYRLKENIAPMTGALAKVAQLKPVTYKWKIDGSDGEGFIAHELAEVKPDCVTGEKDAVDADGNPKYQGIDTSFLVATLTAAIQELKAINDTQAETINALTARVTALENR